MALLLLALAIILALRKLKGLSPKMQQRWLYISAIAVPLLELTHVIWLYTAGNSDWVKLLPLHLCGMQVFFIPLAVFTKKACFQEYIFCTSILGGIFASIFLVGVADTYPFWHYQTIQTLLYHGLLTFVPIALIVTGQYTPNVRNFPKVLGLFLCVAPVAAFIDFTYGENYMFLMEAPGGTPFSFVFEHFGRTAYWVFALISLSLICLAMYWPFERRKKQAARLSLAEDDAC